jgi:hypothetical protein
MSSHTFININLDEATTETSSIDFKEEFNPHEARDWCEVIKDLVAMANSGGGAIIFGVTDDGEPHPVELGRILELDPAKITDKIHKYTEQQFSGFVLEAGKRWGEDVVVLRVAPSRIPIVFTAPGQYNPPENSSKQKSAFAQGTIYFRHGSKSETGNSEDLRQSIERELERVREFWINGIQKVVKADPTSSIQIVAPDVTLRDSSGAAEIRFTDDESAPKFKLLNTDDLFPYRQTEFLRELTNSVGEGVCTKHGFQLARREFKIDDDSNYSSKSKYGSRQYSKPLLHFLVGEFTKDPLFFQKLKDKSRSHS